METDERVKVVVFDSAVEGFFLTHLDGFVNALATRISSFDKQAIAETKRLVNLNSLPPDAEIAPEWDAFLAALGRPAAQARIRMLPRLPRTGRCRNPAGASRRPTRDSLTEPRGDRHEH